MRTIKGGELNARWAGFLAQGKHVTKISFKDHKSRGQSRLTTKKVKAPMSIITFPYHSLLSYSNHPMHKVKVFTSNCIVIHSSYIYFEDL